MNFLTDKIRPIYFKYLAAAFCCFGGQGRRCQRYFDLSAAGHCRCGQHMVCHAHHGACNGGLCGGDDAALPDAANRESCRGVSRVFCINLRIAAEKSGVVLGEGLRRF